MSKECLTVSQSRMKLDFSGSIPVSSNELVNKEQCLTMGAKSDLLVKYSTNWECPADDDIVQEVTSDITDGLIFYVPFTDGTPRDIINNILPTSGYSLVDGQHRFSYDNKYEFRWNVPVGVGTFSIMYKYISKGSTRAFCFGYDGYYTVDTWMGSGGNAMGIWSNIANGGSLSGGNRQWPRGASSTTSGMWTDDYHIVTFTYDFSKATQSTNASRPGMYSDNTSDRSAFRLYKDGVPLSLTVDNSMVNGDGKVLSYVTIGGSSGNSGTSEYTTMYVKDARIYNRCLSESEVFKLAKYCKLK